MGIAAYNRGSRAISDHITQQIQDNRTEPEKPECPNCGEFLPTDYVGRVRSGHTCDLAPDGLPWIIREPNRSTPHSENGWQYHYKT